MKRLALLLAILASPAFGQTVFGPLEAQNNLSEIAANGSAAQSAARTNIGVGSTPGPYLPLAGGTTTGTVTLAGGADLQGGIWGSTGGNLAANRAPLWQNTTFTGSTSGGAAAFGIYLQQTDNSSNTGNGAGIFDQINVNGSSSVGNRYPGYFILNMNQSGNTSGAYVGLTGKCNMDGTDLGPNGSSCYGFNSVASIQAGKTGNILGGEIDTWAQSGATMLQRIGLQIVDVTGAPSYGQQATQDDVALSINNQYANSSSLGFKIGLEFGRYGGDFPVATNGTMIGAQENLGAGFTVANGVDWHLGTFTGNTWNDGHVTISGAGVVATTATTTSTSTTTGAIVDAGGLGVAGAVNVGGITKSASFSTTTNCSSGASPAVCGSAAAGSVAVPTGTNPTLVVDTSAVTANSQILLTPDESLGTKLSVTCNTTVSTLTPAVVMARTAATSFTVEIGATVATNPVCLSYLVIN